MMVSPPSDRRNWAPLALVGLFLVYALMIWPALRGPFLFDDFPNLQPLTNLSANVTARDIGVYLSEARSFPGRPLAMLSFLPQRGSWPTDPFPFKVANLLIHLFNGALVWMLCRKALARLRPEGATWHSAVSAMIALAWLTHPIQLSAFLLVIQRMTLMSTTFVLLGLLAYLRGLTGTGSGEARRGAWMILGIGCTVLAVLCKENGILLPVYAWVLDATIFRRAVQDLPGKLRWLRRALLYPAIAILVLLALTQLQHLDAPLAARNFSMGERLLTEPRVLLDYAINIALPQYKAFGVYHDDFAISRTWLSPGMTIPAMVLVVGGFAAAVVWRKRFPAAAFGILWFLAGHAIEAGPVSLELYFEHRNYLPMLGPLFAVAAGIASASGWRRQIGLALAGIWLAASLVSTGLYARIWANEARIAYFWSQSHPDSVRAQGDYAEILYLLGDLQQSRAVLAASAERRPDDAGVKLNLMFIDCMTGTLAATDVSRLRNELAKAPWSRLGYQSMEQLRLLVGSGQCPSALNETSWLMLSDALLANPAYRSDPVAMGKLHYQRHSLAVAQGDLGQALAELDQTASFDPDPAIDRLKAFYLSDAGLFDQAIAVLRDADMTRRPLLRRLLVDDAAINRQAVQQLQKKQEHR